MSVVLLDTNIVSFFMRNDTRIEEYRPHLEGNTLAISFMTFGELFEGAYRASWGHRRMSKLEHTLRAYVVIPATRRICRFWGRVRAVRRHQPISVPDAWIAATALAQNWALITHNPTDYEAIPSLRIITA